MRNKLNQSRINNAGKVSVIIPVYNAEKCISRCVDSVLCQTYKNIEVILIDDGSSDRSGEIIDNLKSKDERIEVYHEKNGGVAKARNVGINKSSGDYICFVDSDDLIRDIFLEEMLNALITKGADICVSNYNTVEGGSRRENINNAGDNKSFESLLRDNEYGGYCWNKLYRRKTIGSVRFVEGMKIHEDLLFNLEVWGNVRNVAYIKKPLYDYTIRKDSALHSDRSFERFSAIKGIYEILKSRGSKYENDYKLYYLSEYYKKKALGEPISDQAIKNEVKAIFSPMIFVKHGDMTKKIKLILNIMFPKIYCKYDKKRYGKGCTIYTLPGYFNYGNRLQLFALSRIISQLGVTVRVFNKNTRKNAVKEFIKYRTPFSRKYIKEIKLKTFTKNNIARCAKKQYGGYAIVGSDQVWNPNYISKYPYLLKPTNNARLISYAASMGVGELTNEQEEMFRNALDSYRTITVREKTAVPLLQPLTEDEVSVVLDPTLLLQKTEYERLEKQPDDIANGEKYILCYILGNRDYQTAIEEYAESKRLKIILFSDKRDSRYGVEEFLYLIHHAELICTDSFHACVFSLIFERPFVVFKRTGKENYMYSRLQNLLDTFRLKNREYNGSHIVSENANADYSEAKEILRKEQNKSIELLMRALDIKNED